MQNDNAKFKNDFKKRLYAFVLELLKFTETLSKDILSEIMAKQLIRSGTSILTNYIEASSASSRKDFINFFTYSLKSANESKVWPALLRDTGRGDKKLDALLNELTEISKIVASSIITLKGKR